MWIHSNPLEKQKYLKRTANEHLCRRPHLTLCIVYTLVWIQKSDCFSWQEAELGILHTFCSGQLFTEVWIIGGVLMHQPKDPVNVRGLLFRLIRVIKKWVDCRKIKDVIDFLVSSSQCVNISPLKDHLKVFSIILLSPIMLSFLKSVYMFRFSPWNPLQG